MTKRIRVSISPVGRTTIEAEGYTGTACMDATEGFRKAIGARAIDTEQTGDYFASEHEEVKQHVG